MQQTSVLTDQQSEAEASAWLKANVTPTTPAFAVGQRVRGIDPDTGKERSATILEIDASGIQPYARVCFDLKVMHDWLPLASLVPVPAEAPNTPVERLPLATPVRLRNGVEAVISAHSTASNRSYRVSWFDRHFWQVHHRWMLREDLTVIGSAASADNAAPAA